MNNSINETKRGIELKTETFLSFSSPVITFEQRVPCTDQGICIPDNPNKLGNISGELIVISTFR